MISMNLDGITGVLQRISDIEKRIGMQPEMPFQNQFGTELEKAMKTHQVRSGEDTGLQQGSGNVSSGSGEIDNMIRTAADKYNVDPSLLSAIAETESNYKQSAVSSAGAVGIMQLMPDTAASLGVNPYDAQQNIEGGAKYLHGLLNTFGGDVRKAVAAYNAGPNAVKEYNGVPPYKETQNYVDKVLDLYR